MTSFSKNLKKYFLLDFDSILMAWVLSSGVEDTHLQQFFK